jgi:Cu/Ag efflux protein CusF
MSIQGMAIDPRCGGNAERGAFMRDEEFIECVQGLEGLIERNCNMALYSRWDVAVVLFLAGLIGACGNSGDNVPTTKPKVEVMAMRGVIEKMPTAEAPRKLVIRHEATKDMGPMTMPFVVAEGVSLTGLAWGDKIAFRHELNLTAGTELVTQIEKLPADTVLNLGAMSMPTTMKMPGM